MLVAQAVLKSMSNVIQQLAPRSTIIQTAQVSCNGVLHVEVHHALTSPALSWGRFSLRALGERAAEEAAPEVLDVRRASLHEQRLDAERGAFVGRIRRV